jgi:hypothetical protein
VNRTKVCLNIEDSESSATLVISNPYFEIINFETCSLGHPQSAFLLSFSRSAHECLVCFFFGVSFDNLRDGLSPNLTRVRGTCLGYFFWTASGCFGSSLSGMLARDRVRFTFFLGAPCCHSSSWLSPKVDPSAKCCSCLSTILEI